MEKVKRKRLTQQQIFAVADLMATCTLKFRTKRQLVQWISDTLNDPELNDNRPLGIIRNRGLRVEDYLEEKAVDPSVRESLKEEVLRLLDSIIALQASVCEIESRLSKLEAAAMDAEPEPEPEPVDPLASALALAHEYL